MSKSNETPATPTGGNASASVDVSATMAPDLEEGVRYFWEKNRSTLIAVAAVVLIGILGRHGFTMWQDSQSASAREAYAAADSDSARTAFADSHSGTPLAGVALLEVADKAFSDGRYSDAIKNYDAAASDLEGTVFGDRIRLGRAMAQLVSGDTSGGESALRAVANDTTVTGPVRGEAAYHLASRAAAEGKADVVNELATQITSIDPTSNWAQRVSLLQASMANAEDDAASSTGITVPGL